MENFLTVVLVRVSSCRASEPLPGYGVAALGYVEWYLFTEFHEDDYRRFGWSVLERRELHGQTVSIMRQRLPR